MADQLTQLRERIEQMEGEFLEKFRARSSVTHDARELFRTFESAAVNAKMAARGARSRVEQLRADDTMYPEGRDRQIREALEKAKTEIEKQRGRMETALQVLDAHLRTAALPRLDKTREMAARDELRLLLDSSRDPVGLMQELAQRDDEIGAVACSSYGESYLRARGTPEAKKAAQLIRDAAASSAHTSTDRERRAVGEALQELGSLHKARDCTNQIVGAELEGVEAPDAGGRL